MALSLGMRRLVGRTASYAVALAIGSVGLIYHRDIGRIGLAALGVESPIFKGTGAPAAAATASRKSSGRSTELRVRGDGHYYARAEINGRPIDVMVDTGASLVALTYEDARAAGIFVNDRDFNRSVSTANGTARVALVRLDRVEIDGILVRNVDAVVSEPGRMSTTLLGMSFLGKLRRVDIGSGRLVLEE